MYMCTETHRSYDVTMDDAHDVVQQFLQNAALTKKIVNDNRHFRRGHFAELNQGPAGAEDVPGR